MHIAPLVKMLCLLIIVMVAVSEWLMLSFSYLLVFELFGYMNDPEKLISLEKKLAQTENRLMLERNKRRFRQTKQKISYGKMFLIAGALDYYERDIITDKETIELGALVITAKCDEYKIAVILGALSIVLKKCDDDKYLQNCINIGDQFYEHKKLDAPNNFFLGVALKSQKILSDSKNISKCNEIGDQLFTENKMRKLEKYQKFLAEKNGSIGT